MSLRLRLVGAVAAIAVLALASASIATYSILSSTLYHRVDETLNTSHGGFAYAADHGQSVLCARSPRFPRPTGFRLPRPSFDRPGTFLSTQFVEIRTSTGLVDNNQKCPAYIGSKPYAPALPSGSAISANLTAHSGASFFNAPSQAPGGPLFRVRVARLADGDVLIQAIAITDTVNTLHELLIAELFVSLIALLCALGAGWVLVRIGLKPLRAVSRTAASTTTGNLDQRVQVAHPRTEIGELSLAFNAMLDQIQSAFTARDASERQLRQFVADASHELRTPIAAMSAYAELFDRGARNDPDDLERILGGMRTEAARMEELVEDLLILARLDEGADRDRRPVELVRLCSEAIESASKIAPQWPITLVAIRPVEVEGNDRQLRRMIDNLLANVSHHTEAGTSTTVEVRSDAAEAAVVVRDEGAGMDASSARHAFDRFFRGDPSRSRLHGGSGLGLAIVRSIALAHHGSVDLESTPGVGTTVLVRLPLSVHQEDRGAAGPVSTERTRDSQGSLIWHT